MREVWLWGAQSLSHVLSSISGTWRAGDSVNLCSSMDLLTCVGELALHPGDRAACSGAYADAQALQDAVSSLGAARMSRRLVKLPSAKVLLACVGERALHVGERAASGAYADAQALQYAASSLGGARINPRGVL